MSALRIGLVGAGQISRAYVAAMAQVAEGEVVGVWSRTPEHAAGFAREFGLQLGTAKLDELLRRVDVVCVNSPNALHAEHAIAAARAGVHVIVEKPLAASLEQAETIVAACREAGVGLGYAEELAFVPKFVRAKQIVASGELGEITYVTQREAHQGPYSPWFFTREEAGGGVLMDMACHSVELVRWLLGKPEVARVNAHLSRTLHRERTPLEDHAVVQLVFAGGTTSTCEASWVLQGGMQSRLEVWGSEGTLAVDLLHETGLRIYSRKGAASADVGPGWSATLTDPLLENGYPQELSHFLRCFAQGETPEESGVDGVRVMEVLQAAYASAGAGRWVELPFRPKGVERAVDLWLERERRRTPHGRGA